MPAPALRGVGEGWGRPLILWPLADTNPHVTTERVWSIGRVKIKRRKRKYSREIISQYHVVHPTQHDCYEIELQPGH
jgi:hypothetical protein